MDKKEKVFKLQIDKRHILTRNLSEQMFDYFQTRLEQLFDYQKSCLWIFFETINGLNFAVLPLMY